MKTVLVKLLIISSLLMAFGCTVASTQTIESISTESPPASRTTVNLEVIDFPKAQSHSLVAGPAGSLYLLYGQDQSLFIARSTDGGKTFNEPVLATGDIPVHVLAIEHPAVAVNATGQVGIAWLEVPPDFNGAKIWYSGSEDDGKTFKPGRLVATEAEGEVTMVQVALDNAGNPSLMWLRGSELKFVRSPDQGSTFSQPLSIGDGSCECCQPQAVILDETIHITYRSLEPGNEKGDIRDIVMINSRNGETFDPVRRVSDEHWYLPACPIAGPSLAVHEGSLYVAWMDGRLEPAGAFRRGDIWLASSSDGGKTFSSNIRINADQTMHHSLPSIAIGPGGRIHAAWEAQAKREAFLYYSTSDDGGQSFASPQIIADNAVSDLGAPSKPQLVADPAGHITLTWLDRSGVRLATWADTH